MRLGRALTTAVVALAAIAPAAQAASLPSVRSGARPGPPVLYRSAPAAPQLSVAAPFRAKPLLVSGTDALRRGEYLYQDYLFDDRGADTVPGRGNQRDEQADFSPAAGDVQYPTAARYGGNAADLVEFRVVPRSGDLVYRITLNTVKADDAAIVGIGIDSDRSGGAAVAWPKGAGITSPGLDAFITAWGTGGEVHTGPGLGTSQSLPAGAVTIDRTSNQMQIRVPRSLAGMNPGSSTWRYVAGVGLNQGGAFKPVPPSPVPGSETAASGSALPAPAVFNLAFRFDEPQGSALTGTGGYTTFPGVGNWFEDKQATVLRGGTSGDFGADVDFGALGGVTGTRRLHAPPGREQARIFASRLPVEEGFHAEFPEYGGQLQPYLLTVPPGYDAAKPAGLTFTLHSLGGNYTQYKVFSPNQLRQFGDQRQNLVVSPLGRGPDGWYGADGGDAEDEGLGEADVFEAWADVARNFKLDSERVALTGYSMGGYGTYRLGTYYPDLFGKAFTTVGPPGRGIWIPPAPPVDGGQDSNTNPLLENVRWVPYMNWVELTDQLVPYPGPRAQQNRFTALGLRSQLWTFTPGDHFTLAILDQWEPARDFLGSARVKRDPSRVNYAFMPDTDRPDLGLRHDHAYWVSGLRVRDRSGDPERDPARGEIDARSLVFGEGDPVTKPVLRAEAGPPEPSAVDGIEWERIRRIARENALEVKLDNVRAATLDGRRARLSTRRNLRVTLESDGAGTARLRMPLPRGTRVIAVRGAGARSRVTISRRGASFRVVSGRATYVLGFGRSAQRGRSPRFTG